MKEYYELGPAGEEGGRGRAGVAVNGERIEADVVVGADGVKSAARKLVLVSFPRRALFLTDLVVLHLSCSSQVLPCRPVLFTYL